MKNADNLAFPIELSGFGQIAPEIHGGMTKREMLAMHAMQGLLSSDDSSIAFYKSDSDAKHIAQSAVAYADALLEELSK